jgi:hypothetical protein
MCKNGIHYFKSKDWSSRCDCLLWSRREHATRQASQRIKSGSRQLWKDSKKTWAIDKLAKPVNQIKNNKVIAIFRGMAEAEAITGIDHRLISLVTRGIRKTTGGYIWHLA